MRTSLEETLQTVGIMVIDGSMSTSLEALGCTDPREAVLLGDSLSSAVGCARAAGIDSIWLAPAGQTSPLPTWTVHSLEEAQRILLGTR